MNAPVPASPAPPPKPRWVHWMGAGLSLLAAVLLAGLYAGLRFTQDAPVDYADIVEHFKYGSTGGERQMGIPYWIWVALPELFPEYLPDQKPGRGYASFGMIYESSDPRY